MRKLIKTITNAAFVVGGFIVVFFWVSKMSDGDGGRNLPLFKSSDDVVHADTPYAYPYPTPDSYPTPSSGSGDSSGGGGSK